VPRPNMKKAGAATMNTPSAAAIAITSIFIYAPPRQLRRRIGRNHLLLAARNEFTKPGRAGEGPDLGSANYKARLYLQKPR